MSPSPRISIVTPVLNGAVTVERCLDAVWRQKAHVLEHVVVDGGSDDGTLDILKRRQASQKGFLRFSSGPDLGIADAFNKALRECRGEWIGIINADDWYEDGAIGALLPHMGREVILHGRTRVHQPSTGAARESGPLDYIPEKHFRPLESMPAQHPTCFVPRAVYDKVGLFNTSFRYAMDYEFLLRAHLAGVEFEYLPRVIANFSLAGTSARDPRASLREAMIVQMLHRGEVWGPLRLYLKNIVGGAMRRTRRRLLRRKIV